MTRFTPAPSTSTNSVGLACCSLTVLLVNVTFTVTKTFPVSGFSKSLPEGASYFTSLTVTTQPKPSLAHGWGAQDPASPGVLAGAAPGLVDTVGVAVVAAFDRSVLTPGATVTTQTLINTMRASPPTTHGHRLLRRGRGLDAPGSGG